VQQQREVTPTLDFIITARDEAWLRQIQIRPDTPEPIENPGKGIVNGLLISGFIWLLIGLAVAYWR